jgi:3-deoxy-manno-octulosonate cytidylyltransferase (CMP-KDO synthetase)
MSDFAVVIPCRYASTRLPGKPLRAINGKPMLEHVHARATESSAAEIVVATDDERIAEAAGNFGARVCMTGRQHRSGSDRIAEVCDRLGWDDDRVVVNLQGDEPTMPAALIDQCARLLDDRFADIATLASPFESRRELANENVVKVVLDRAGNAIYFSRAAIPFERTGHGTHEATSIALHHHGIYAYRCGVLRRFVSAAPAPLELCEQLEQLRALYLGMTVRVAKPVERPGSGVDTEEDLLAAGRTLAAWAERTGPGV